MSAQASHSAARTGASATQAPASQASASPIVHVVENLERGGLERMVIDLALEQRARGAQVGVVCLFQPGALADELRTQGVPVLACGKRSGLDLGALARLRDALRGAAVAGAAEVGARLAAPIVHTHNATAHYHAALAVHGLPLRRLINTRHGMGVRRPRSRQEWLYRRSMARTDTVAAVCEAARRRYAADGVRPRRALLAVPNGIRIERFHAASDDARTALCAQLGLAPGTRIVGTVGRLNPVKDQALLLSAFAEVHAERADSALVLVGDGPLRAALQAQAEALGIAHAVRLLGDRGDVPALLAGFDQFVLCSRSEGYSMALLEASASALPIVASDVGGNREIVADGATGRVVPAQSLPALRDAVLALLRAPEQARALGAAGRAWALREATVAAMADRYDALYRDDGPAVAVAG
jgi:glycosyltransferase involved in cell wall biosynthesis